MALKDLALKDLASIDLESNLGPCHSSIDSSPDDGLLGTLRAGDDEDDDQIDHKEEEEHHSCTSKHSLAPLPLHVVMTVDALELSARCRRLLL